MTRENEDAKLEHAEPDSTEAVVDLPLDDLNMRRLIELDACTHCGECLNWCPVYDQDAREDIIPRRKVIDFLRIVRKQQGLLNRALKNGRLPAPIRKILLALAGHGAITHEEIQSFVKNLYECSTCGQCEIVCPAHIDTVNLWEDLRRIIVQAGYGPLEPQKALEKSVKSFDNPWQQPRAGRANWARRAKKDGLIKDLPPEIKKNHAKVLLFFGCTAAYDVNVKQVAIYTVNILDALNIDYGVLGKDEKCCGSVLLRMGDPEHRRLFKENIEQFNDLGFETLITSCSGCFKTIKQDYPNVGRLNFEVLHTVEYLVRLLEAGRLEFKHPVNKKVTYHDPCHLGRATHVFDAPRTIMNAIPGLELVEMPRNRHYSRCCGAGGGLKAGYPEVQNKMAQRRVQEAESTGANYLVSCCPFCFQGLQVGINTTGSAIQMADMSALVSESLLGYNVFEKAEQEAAQKAKAKAEARAKVEKPAAAAGVTKPEKTGMVAGHQAVT